MKIAGGIEEDGIVTGNVYDKYGSKNPVVVRIMEGFNKSLAELVDKAAPEEIHEIGCGEGYWVMQWNRQGFDARGSDFSSQVIDMARENAISNDMSPDVYEQLSIYDVDAVAHSADLVVCCEVLEHLEYPEKALKSLQCIAVKNLIISVPREPVWRILNLVRGKYIFELGNTPGHIQHWSREDFIKLVEQYFDIITIKTPLPWTMLLCRSSREK